MFADALIRGQRVAVQRQRPGRHSDESAFVRNNVTRVAPPRRTGVFKQEQSEVRSVSS